MLVNKMDWGSFLIGAVVGGVFTFVVILIGLRQTLLSGQLGGIVNSALLKETQALEKKLKDKDSNQTNG